MMLCGALLATGGLGMAYCQGYFTLSLFTFIFGFGYGAIWPVYAACAPDYFPKKIAGSVIGLWTVYLGVGSILSPIIAGWTIDATGKYTWAFIIAVISATVSSLLLVPITRTSFTSPS